MTNEKKLVEEKDQLQKEGRETKVEEIKIGTNEEEEQVYFWKYSDDNHLQKLLKTLGVTKTPQATQMTPQTYQAPPMMSIMSMMPMFTMQPMTYMVPCMTMVPMPTMVNMPTMFMTPTTQTIPVPEPVMQAVSKVPQMFPNMETLPDGTIKLIVFDKNGKLIIIYLVKDSSVT